MNTIQIKRRLVEKGIEEPHAEGIAEEIGTAVDEKSVTKQGLDLALAEQEIRLRRQIWAGVATLAALLSIFEFLL
jgi:hypothetical protein